MLDIRYLGICNFNGKTAKTFLIDNKDLVYLSREEEEDFLESLGFEKGHFDEADIRDKSLENAIRIELEKDEGILLKSDLLRVEKLDISTHDVKDFTGLEDLRNLKFFRAWMVPGVSGALDKLKELKKLEYIDVGSSDLVYLKKDTFEGLTELKEVAIDGNLMYELPDGLFETNKNLKWLHVDSTGIAELNFLQGLTNLESLFAEDNRINNLSGLVHTPKLKVLRLSNNNLKALSFIRGLNKLESLYIDNNQIKTLLPLTHLKELNKLKADYNQIEDIHYIRDLHKLEYLYLDGNNIRDISPLRRMYSLVQLQIRNNRIKTVEPLKNLTNLRVLNIDGNPIINYRHLKGIYNKLTNKDF